jgi:predicted Fe-Mo cluster-binding NifX family protein
MKISVPSNGQGGIDDMVGQHFGQVPNYTIYDTETKEVEILPNTSEHNGGVGLPPELMSKAGVHVMLCGGLGKKAVDMFERFEIDVFVGANGLIKDAIESWNSGQLAKATKDNSCSGHDHDHDSGDGHCH